MGLGFAPSIWLTNILEPPWSLEPTLGSFNTRDEFAAHPGLLLLNTVARIQGFLVRCTLGPLITNLVRFRLGVGLHFTPAGPTNTHPWVVPSLPEFHADAPGFINSRTVMAGMYDHPSLEGSSLGKSEERDKIMSFLDEQQSRSKDVLYSAFGSEVVLDAHRADLLLHAFSDTPVLWALRKPPPGLKERGGTRYRVEQGRRIQGRGCRVQGARNG